MTKKAWSPDIWTQLLWSVIGRRFTRSLYKNTTIILDFLISADNFRVMA